MITKKEFTEYISEFQEFEKAINKISEAICGSKYGCSLFESDWYCSVEHMINIFLDSHFTDIGVDWITYYLWEPIEDKLVTVKKEKDIFNEEKEIEYHLNSIDELWNFLLTDPELYFKNYNKDE